MKPDQSGFAHRQLFSYEEQLEIYKIQHDSDFSKIRDCERTIAIQRVNLADFRAALLKAHALRWTWKTGWWVAGVLIIAIIIKLMKSSLR